MAQTISRTELEKLYAEGMRAASAGRTEEALGLFGRIVAADPKIAEVHYQIGRIFTAEDRAPRALRHLAAAAQLKPGTPEIWRAWAAAVALAGEAEGRAAFLAALKKAPVSADLRIELQDRFAPSRLHRVAGMTPALQREMQGLFALLPARRFAELEARTAALARQHPKAAILPNLRGTALVHLGRPAEAITAFRQALALDPGYAEAHDNLGLFLMQIGREAEAAREFRAALALTPDRVELLVHLALALIRLDRLPLAKPYLDRALALDPRNAPAMVAQAKALTRLRQYGEVEAVLRRALEIDPDLIEAYGLLGQALHRLGRDREAIQAFDAALAREPNHLLSIIGKAGVHQALGEFEAAEPQFRRAFALDPNTGENYRVFIATHKTTADDPILPQMKARFDDSGIGDANRASLGFAISKALEDIRDYRDVFRYLNEANALTRKLNPFDIAQRFREVEGLRAALRGFDYAQARIPGTSDYAPIFITGMPRSGTTLVEQIISSHSQVTGAGEVGEAVGLGTRLMMAEGGRAFRPLDTIPAEEIAGLGRSYEATMRARFSEAGRLTDKSIQTYLLMGLIRLALPNARFVVVRRDPRDNLLSIYKNRFPDGTHLYAYDLRDLALYYRTFVEMVEFWRAEVPGLFYELNYEDLVADPEPETRKLIAACGLDWEDACLSHHQNTRRVDTLSVFQVRQPISSASVQSWRRYETDLAPLFEALGDLLPEDTYAAR